MRIRSGKSFARRTQAGSRDRGQSRQSTRKPVMDCMFSLSIPMTISWLVFASHQTRPTGDIDGMEKARPQASNAGSLVETPLLCTHIDWRMRAESPPIHHCSCHSMPFFPQPDFFSPACLHCTEYKAYRHELQAQLHLRRQLGQLKTWSAWAVLAVGIAWTARIALGRLQGSCHAISCQHGPSSHCGTLNSRAGLAYSHHIRRTSLCITSVGAVWADRGFPNDTSQSIS